MSSDGGRPSPAPTLDILGGLAECKRISDLELNLQDALEQAALGGLIDWALVLQVIRALERGVWAAEHPDHPWACPWPDWEPWSADQEAVRRLIRHPAVIPRASHGERPDPDSPDSLLNSQRVSRTHPDSPRRTR